MIPFWVLNCSVSWPPGSCRVIWTVAPLRLALSGSLTTIPESTAVAVCSSAEPAASVGSVAGASLTCGDRDRLGRRVRRDRRRELELGCCGSCRACRWSRWRTRPTAAPARTAPASPCPRASATPAAKLPVMPFWVVKSSVSPATGETIVTVARSGWRRRRRRPAHERRSTATAAGLLGVGRVAGARRQRRRVIDGGDGDAPGRAGALGARRR